MRSKSFRLFPGGMFISGRNVDPDPGSRLWIRIREGCGSGFNRAPKIQKNPNFDIFFEYIFITVIKDIIQRCLLQVNGYREFY